MTRGAERNAGNRAAHLLLYGRTQLDHGWLSSVERTLGEHARDEHAISFVHGRHLHLRAMELRSERRKRHGVAPSLVREGHLHRVLDGLLRASRHREDLQRQQALAAPGEQRWILRVVAADTCELLVLVRRRLGLHEIALEPDRLTARVPSLRAEPCGDRLRGDIEKEEGLVAPGSGVPNGAGDHQRGDAAINLHVHCVDSLAKIEARADDLVRGRAACDRGA